MTYSKIKCYHSLSDYSNCCIIRRNLLMFFLSYMPQETFLSPRLRPMSSRLDLLIVPLMHKLIVPVAVAIMVFNLLYNAFQILFDLQSRRNVIWERVRDIVEQ